MPKNKVEEKISVSNLKVKLVRVCRSMYTCRSVCAVQCKSVCKSVYVGVCGSVGVFAVCVCFRADYCFQSVCAGVCKGEYWCVEVASSVLRVQKYEAFLSNF